MNFATFAGSQAADPVRASLPCVESSRLPPCRKVIAKVTYARLVVLRSRARERVASERDLGNARGRAHERFGCEAPLHPPEAAPTICNRVRRNMAERGSDAEVVRTDVKLVAGFAS